MRTDWLRKFITASTCGQYSLHFFISQNREDKAIWSHMTSRRGSERKMQEPNSIGLSAECYNGNRNVAYISLNLSEFSRIYIDETGFIMMVKYFLQYLE